MKHKRRKSRRMRGSHTCGRGGKKKARGSGHRGGFGMAGTGKRADQRKTLVLNLYPEGYFGKSKTLRMGTRPIKLKSINLSSIQSNYSGKKELDFRGYKILGEGELTEKVILKASAASKSAIDKVKKLGGDILIEK